jgi:hypothetical protein
VEDIRAEHFRYSSTLSFARSLFTAAEGKELFDRRFFFPSAVSAYYSLFHLAGALILAYCSRNLSAPICVTVLKWQDGEQRHAPANTEFPVPDPAQGISHNDPPKFLKNQTPGIVGSLGERGIKGTLRDMREFVSYAPRLRSDGRRTILYSACQYTPDEFSASLDEHLNRMNECFHEAMQWLNERSLDEVHRRLFTSDFILYEFDGLGVYHGEAIRKRAGNIYCSLCEAEGVDWKVYRPDPDPKTWRDPSAEEGERRRHQRIVDSWTAPAQGGPSNRTLLSHLQGDNQAGAKSDLPVFRAPGSTLRS